MSEESKKAREAMKAKAKRLVAGDPREKVDSSSWSPPEAELGDVQTGARPLVKRLYKKGGKVVGKSEGKEANKHGGRAPRKSGGKNTHKAPWIDDLINRDVRMANDEREGEKHTGAFKKGGKAKKFGGGPIGGNNPISQQDEMMGKAAGMRKHGGKTKGREHHAEGDVVGDMIRRDQIEQGMKGRGLPERVPMPPRRPVEKTKPFKDPIPPSSSPTFKEGGKIKHTDEAQDKKLMHKVLKPTVFKAKGGEAMHHKDCTCKMCGGGRTMKYAGGGVFSGNSKEKVPGADGGRKARYLGGPLMNNPMGGAMGTGAPSMAMQAATQPAPMMGTQMGYPMPRKAGGRTKGKTQVNIMIGAHPAQPAGNVPNMPVAPPRPPQGVPVPPPTMAGGAPMMPPGGPQMPPPGLMPRKSGGRTNYPIDTGSGGGNARLEKIDAYGLKPPRKK